MLSSDMSWCCHLSYTLVTTSHTLVQQVMVTNYHVLTITSIWSASEYRSWALFYTLPVLKGILGRTTWTTSLPFQRHYSHFYRFAYFEWYFKSREIAATLMFQLLCILHLSTTILNIHQLLHFGCTPLKTQMVVWVISLMNKISR